MAKNYDKLFGSNAKSLSKKQQMPQFKLGLKDRFGNFRSTKIRIIKNMEEQKENDYYLTLNAQSKFFRDKIAVSNPVFLSNVKRKAIPKFRSAYQGPLIYDYQKPDHKKSWHFNLNNGWC